jgi:tetratricopeptide (TPR) repeat protein
MDVNEKAKTNVTALQKAAQDFSVKGDYDNAIAAWKKILAVREDANTYNTIGDLYIKKREQNEALKYFTQAADKFKGDGFYEKAMAIYKKILNIVPYEVTALDSLADLYAKKGLSSNAVTYYLKAAEKFSRDKELDKSVDIYNKILRITPSDINIKIKIADSWLSKGLSEKAANEYAEIATDYLGRDEFDKSIEFFSKAIGLDPQNVAAFTGLSNLAEKQNNVEQALEFAAKALHFSQNDNDILLKYIQLAAKAGKPEDAKNTLVKLIASAPADIFYKKLLCKIYINEGQTGKAWEELHSFIDELLQDQNWVDAYELLEPFKESFPTPVKQRLVTVYRGKGDIESLTAELKDLAKIYEDQGAAQNALGLYRELAELQPDNVSFKNKVEEMELFLDLKMPLSPAGPLLHESEISVERKLDDVPQDNSQDKRADAEFYANQGLIHEAISLYEEILASEPDNMEIQHKIELLRSVPDTDPEVLANPPSEEIPAQTGGSPVVNELYYDPGTEEEDYESHYTAGIEYKQKGLIDDAIREFQIVAKDPEKALLSSKMIALCYMEKGAFMNAIMELNMLLESMSYNDERCLDVKYDLADAYMKNNDYIRALEIYSEIRTVDPDYRDISYKIDILKDLIEKSEGKQKSKKNRISYI